MKASELKVGDAFHMSNKRYVYRVTSLNYEQDCTKLRVVGIGSNMEGYIYRNMSPPVTLLPLYNSPLYKAMEE